VFVAALLLSSTACSGGTARVETGLRGVPVARVNCRSVRPLGKRTVIRAPQVFVICRYGLGGVARPSVTVAARTPSYQRLLVAFSERDLPPTSAACLVLTEVEIPVFAQTSEGTYKLTEPRDGCDLIRREVYAAIDAAVGTKR